jgi:hypothetical protein
MLQVGTRRTWSPVARSGLARGGRRGAKLTLRRRDACRHFGGGAVVAPARYTAVARSGLTRGGAGEADLQGGGEIARLRRCRC